MKVAKIRPIYKRGNKQEISNYRPIRLVSFTTKFKILTANQYGVKKRKRERERERERSRQYMHANLLT
jgi:hypothetical protein